MESFGLPIEEKNMQGINLDLKDFIKLNDEDCFMFFENERIDKFNSLPEEDRYDFDFDSYHDELAASLFKKYQYIVITPEDKVYGYDGRDYVFLKEAEGVFECAQNK